jgi:hypothetical protein
MNLKATDNLNDGRPVVIVDFIYSESSVWAIIVDEEGAIRATHLCSLTIPTTQREALGMGLDKGKFVMDVTKSVQENMRKEVRKGIKFGEDK